MTGINLAELLHTKAAEVTPSTVEQKINAYEAVRQCLVEIRDCRKRNLSWNEIAELVKSVVLEAYAIELRLTGATAQHYYYKLTRKKRSNHRPASRKSAQRSRTSKAQLPTIEVIPLEKPKEIKPKKIEPIEVPTPVAPKEGALLKKEQDESTAAPLPPAAEPSNESSQSDPYKRPAGSRFTKGHKVKYWNGGTS